MPLFSYTAVDRTGRRIEGTVEAVNSAVALGRVKAMGLEVERVRAAGPAPAEAAGNAYPSQRGPGAGERFLQIFVYPWASGVSLKDLAVFYRQFSTMINAGIPMIQCLATLEGQTRSPRLRAILHRIQPHVMNGGRLSEVMAEYPWVFRELEMEMIRAAEMGGVLENMLRRIADYLEQEIALRRLISRLTLYPKIVLFLAWMILGKSFFSDALPAFSKLVLGSMGKQNYSGVDYLFDTFIAMAYVLLGIFACVAVARIFLFQSDRLEESYERVKHLIPGLGKVSLGFALAKFGRAFGALYAAGMPLGTAIRIGGNASGSKVLKRATYRAMMATERGCGITESFRATGCFPQIVLDMLHTGEQSGNVDAMMEKVSEYLENEAESKAHMYSHFFAVGIFLVVAFLVGMAIVRFWSGYGAGITGAAGG
jgi:type II secretory pathway component PulF